MDPITFSKRFLMFLAGLAILAVIVFCIMNPMLFAILGGIAGIGLVIFLLMFTITVLHNPTIYQHMNLQEAMKHFFET